MSETGAPMSGDSNLLVTWELSSGAQLYLVIVVSTAPLLLTSTRQQAIRQAAAPPLRAAFAFLQENEPAHSLRVHQVSASDAPRALPPIAPYEDVEEDYGGLPRLMSGLPDASDDADDGRRLYSAGKSGGVKKHRREGEEGEGPAPRQRFTEEEILAVRPGAARRVFSASANSARGARVFAGLCPLGGSGVCMASHQAPLVFGVCSAAAAALFRAQLVEGVRLFGTSWARIKSTFATQLARRTQVSGPPQGGC